MSKSRSPPRGNGSNGGGYADGGAGGAGVGVGGGGSETGGLVARIASAKAAAAAVSAAPEPGAAEAGDAAAAAADAPVADGEDALMMQMMGFSSGGFGSTKGKHVDGNIDPTLAANKKKRRYRQYMNRKGGFNRLLANQQ